MHSTRCTCIFIIGSGSDEYHQHASIDTARTVQVRHLGGIGPHQDQLEAQPVQIVSLVGAINQTQDGANGHLSCVAEK